MEILTLKKRKDFVRVAQKGLKMITSTVILQATQNLCADDTNVYVGYTTTKKIGKAHIRNRTRRRLRAVVRENFGKHALPGYTYVLIGRYNTAECLYRQLAKDLKFGLKKLKHLALKQEKTANVQPAEASPDMAD